jgi:hypothetical protein
MTEEILPEITNLVPMKRTEEEVNQNKCGMINQTKQREQDIRKSDNERIGITDVMFSQGKV